MCYIYSGRVSETISITYVNSKNCIDIRCCIFENLPSSVAVNNINNISIIKSHFIDNFKNVSLIIISSALINIRDSCFFRCSLQPPYHDSDGCVIRIFSSNSSLSGISIFGCSAPMATSCDRYVICFFGDKGSLTDTNSSFNRMCTGSGPNIAASKSRFEWCQIIGSVTYNWVSYFQHFDEPQTFKNLVFSNNNKPDAAENNDGSLIMNYNKNVDVTISGSFFIHNNHHSIFSCAYKKIISRNNFFSCSIRSSNLVDIDDSNALDQRGDYSFPEMGRHVGCIGIGAKSKPGNKMKPSFVVFAFSSIINSYSFC